MAPPPKKVRPRVGARRYRDVNDMASVGKEERTELAGRVTPGELRWASKEGRAGPGRPGHGDWTPLASPRCALSSLF